ncbi:hypothetical protein [Streptomyces durocortorensis]|uniref:Uncharacterized protein n=1 Tax=Streptomyces durocortorensis TaxID=2811104 RepID=A0ABS2HRL6_9ACTN|nr:hypothetical protein [Streptomyces durocortorensis]MBM7053724.1 hypothetical protein [Streptomyces durocortorensis]
MRWVRCFWDEEAISFHFELDTDGYVIRQVEFQEPGGEALATTNRPPPERFGLAVGVDLLIAAGASVAGEISRG